MAPRRLLAKALDGVATCAGSRLAAFPDPPARILVALPGGTATPLSVKQAPERRIRLPSHRRAAYAQDIPKDQHVMPDTGELSFTDALRMRTDHMLDACTRCGECVKACPMTEPAGLDPANASAIADGILDLLAGGAGTPDAERWAQVCTNSGKCIAACEHGINPRLMVNMARVASKAKQGDAAVRRAGQEYFNNMSRGTRVISRLQLPAEVLARLNPPLRPAGEYDRTPDIVFYTGCNVIKTPHIALLVLEVLDALGVTYEIMGGNSTCCGIQQFKQGDAKTAGRVAYNTIERLSR